MSKRANGDGGISEVNGRYRIRVTINGERRSLGYCATKAEARKVIRDTIRAVEEGRVLARQSPTLEQFLLTWMDTVKEPQLRQQTVGFYDDRLEHVVTYMGSTRLTDLRPEQFEGLYKHLLDKHLAPRTIRMTHTILRQAIEHAIDRDYLVRSPMRTVKPPKVESHDPPVLTLAQIKQIIDETRDDRLHAMWVLFVTTGIRQGEARALHWSDVGAGTIYIQHTASQPRGLPVQIGPPKTERSKRVVDLPASTIDALERHRQRQRLERAKRRVFAEPTLVFCTTSDKPLSPSYVNTRWHAMARRLGLPDTGTHIGRHSVGTHVAESGGDIHDIQHLLGHANKSTTYNTYLHRSPNARHSLAQDIEALIRSEKRVQ